MAKYDNVIKKEKKKEKKTTEKTDNGENLTPEQRFNLINNLICPVCSGITSFINAHCLVQEILKFARVCDNCDKHYELSFKLKTSEENKQLFDSVLKNTFGKYYQCRFYKNLVIRKEDACTPDKCKGHLKKVKIEWEN
jgi:hypothetical protein